MDGILPFLINTAMDSLLLIAVIVVAVTVGKPLSYLDCKVIGQVSGASSSAYAFTTALGDSLDQAGGNIDYNHWIGGTKSTCLEMKSIWGLSIALWFVISTFEGNNVLTVLKHSFRFLCHLQHMPLAPKQASCSKGCRRLNRSRTSKGGILGDHLSNYFPGTHSFQDMNRRCHYCYQAIKTVGIV
jgi:hypothetical protein